MPGTMELPKLEPMSVGQILIRSFRLCLRNFWWFLGMAIVVYLPLTVVQLIFKLYESTETVSNLGNWKFPVFDIPQGLVVGLVGTFVSFSLSIAIFRNISGHYRDNHVAFWETYKFTWSKFKIILVASVLFTIFFYVPRTLSTLPEKLGAEPTGFLGAIIIVELLAVAVIVTLVMLWFAVTPQCIAATNLSAWQSMKQSKALVKGSMWRIIALGAFLTIIVIGIYLIVWPVDLLFVHLGQSVFTESNIVVSFKPTMIGILWSPLIAVVLSLLYYDLRARKESSEAETIEGFLASRRERFEKARTSRLAIASVVLGLLGMITGACVSTAIPGLILGISAVIAIQSRKEELTGQLKGRGLALVGIGISCMVLYFTYIQVLPFFPPLKTSPCEPGEVLRSALLGDLPSSATSVQAEKRLRGGSGKQYLVFQATAEDIEKFVAESESLKNQEPMLFNSDNMYLPQKYRSKFKDEKEWQKYSRHEHFRRRSYWPDWYDPTVRLKGGKYDISISEDGRQGSVVINDETNTVYIRVRW